MPDSCAKQMGILISLVSAVMGLCADRSAAEQPAPLAAEQTAPTVGVDPRLPRFCRYELDLTGYENPHVVLSRATGSSDLTCPFAPSDHPHATVFEPKGSDGCGAKNFRALKIISITELIGRDARREMQCLSSVKSPSLVPKPVGEGKSWLLTFKEGDASLKERVAFAGYVDTARLGGPFTEIASGTLPNGSNFQDAIAMKCVSMMRGVQVSAKSFFLQTLPEFPTRISEEDVSGRDCAEVIRERVGDHGGLSDAAVPLVSTDGVDSAGTFKLWLFDTPVSGSLVLRLALTKSIMIETGATSKHPHLKRNQVQVFRTKDDGYLALTFGPDIVTIDLRHLTRGVCTVIFKIVSRNNLYLHTLQSDFLSLRSASTAKDPNRSAGDIIVADDADLCELLRPGFEEWQSDAPQLPANLNDLDGKKTGFITFKVSKAPASSGIR